MINRLKAKGVKTITITEPFILTTSNRWEEAVEENILATDKLGHPYTYDFYFGNTGLIDIYNPGGASWFWSIYKELHNKGIAGIWGDLGSQRYTLPNYNIIMVRLIWCTIFTAMIGQALYIRVTRKIFQPNPFILMRWLFWITTLRNDSVVWRYQSNLGRTTVSLKLLCKWDCKGWGICIRI